LKAHENNPNLVILTGAHVSQIVLGKRESGWVATGVEFLKGEEKTVVNASKEVILSAGLPLLPSLYPDSELTPRAQVHSTLPRSSSSPVLAPQTSSRRSVSPSKYPT
jgi:choline dehydrogenase-like flavoprotein